MFCSVIVKGRTRTTTCTFRDEFAVVAAAAVAAVGVADDVRVRAVVAVITRDRGS